MACYRSSHQMCSLRKGVLRKFTKFTGKHLRKSPFFNKVAGLRPATLSKNKPWHRCFPVNFAKFLRTHFLQNTSGWLLLLLGPWGFTYYLIFIANFAYYSLLQNFLPEKDHLLLVAKVTRYEWLVTRCRNQITSFGTDIFCVPILFCHKLLKKIHVWQKLLKLRTGKAWSHVDFMFFNFVFSLSHLHFLSF